MLYYLLLFVDDGGGCIDIYIQLVLLFLILIRYIYKLLTWCMKFNDCGKKDLPHILHNIALRCIIFIYSICLLVKHTSMCGYIEQHKLLFLIKNKINLII